MLLFSHDDVKCGFVSQPVAFGHGFIVTWPGAHKTFPGTFSVQCGTSGEEGSSL